LNRLVDLDEIFMEWWHWILSTVSLYMESKHINSSQNFFLYHYHSLQMA
jgi:hypothetical protein